MIYISAQPDDYYFLWQLKLQLHNFCRMGIKKDNIHVLIGFDKHMGLSSYFQDFIQTNCEALFFPYPDERISKAYLSSLRPNLLSQHYFKYKWLENEAVFYHDSDVIFNSLPDFELLLKDDFWYASDTRSYTGVDAIFGTGGRSIFYQMCNVLEVDPNLIEINDINAGGAQYVLKNVHASFWEKLEFDTERMFGLLNDYNNCLGLCNKQQRIQAWCADMWCLWWGAIVSGLQVRTHEELSFSWVHSPIELEQKNRIVHYTGKVSHNDKHLFRKNGYVHCSPFFDDFSTIDQNTSSYTVVKEIANYNKKNLDSRIDLLDVSFLIPIRIDSEERLANIYTVCQYLHVNFNTNIILIEADETSKIDKRRISEMANYTYIQDTDPIFYHTKYNNKLIELAETPFIALYDTDVVFPIHQIVEAVSVLRHRECKMVYPYDGSFVRVGILMKMMFSKLLDIEVLENNRGKLNVGSFRSYGGCVFLDKRTYVKAGMDNERLTSWGPEDIERWKRMLLLGHRIERIPGNLYHLQHPRFLNSRYNSEANRIELINEYLKICSMQKNELLEYIATWK